MSVSEIVQTLIGPPVQITATYTMQGWARFALTGGTLTGPSNETLALLVLSVTRELTLAFPCVGATPETTLTGGDLAAWNEWSGYLIAAKFLLSPAGKPFVSSVTEIKAGPVTKRMGSSTGAAEQAADFRKNALAARNTIACIRAGFASTRPSASLRLAGYRRAIESRS